MKNWRTWAVIAVTLLAVVLGKPVGAEQYTPQQQAWSDSMHAEMDRAAPRWRALNVDPAFIAWTRQRDPATGRLRNDIMQKLWLAHDSRALAAWFNAYARQDAVSVASSWVVPIRRQGKSIELEGRLNGTVPVRWTLDTGASLTSIPMEMAKALGARVVDRRNFELADGSIISSPIVVIRKLEIGGMVSVANIRAAVSDYGTDALLGKNFLDAFGSYEISNSRNQLILKR